jgi:hypothetical protein
MAQSSGDSTRALSAVLHEIVHGADPKAGWMLNPGDAGLLRSLDHLSAEEASLVPEGSASVAAHAEHLRYGLELLARWADGEDPYGDADWTAAWRRTHVTDAEWAELRGALAELAARLDGNLERLLDRGEAERTATIACVAHLAYHLGAMRQIQRAARGPSAEQSQ